MSFFQKLVNSTVEKAEWAIPYLSLIIGEPKLGKSRLIEGLGESCLVLTWEPEENYQDIKGRFFNVPIETDQYNAQKKSEWDKGEKKRKFVPVTQLEFLENVFFPDYKKGIIAKRKEMKEAGEEGWESWVPFHYCVVDKIDSFVEAADKSALKTLLRNQAVRNKMKEHSGEWDGKTLTDLPKTWNVGNGWNLRKNAILDTVTAISCYSNEKNKRPFHRVIILGDAKIEKKEEASVNGEGKPITITREALKINISPGSVEKSLREIAQLVGFMTMSYANTSHRFLIVDGYNEDRRAGGTNMDWLVQLKKITISKRSNGGVFKFGWNQIFWDYNFEESRYLTEEEKAPVIAEMEKRYSSNGERSKEDIEGEIEEAIKNNKEFN